MRRSRSSSMRSLQRRRHDTTVLAMLLGFLLASCCATPGARAEAVTAVTAHAPQQPSDQPADVLSVTPVSSDGMPPAAFPAQGIIDPQAPQNSDDPGVLVPLAQARSSTSHWMDAVAAAGPDTPLSNPMFEGTVFLPSDTAFEQAYPSLAQQAGAGPGGAFDGFEASKLAAQLNSLTVPGVRLRLEQLRTGQTLETADGGTLKVLSAGAGLPVKLQQQPSGLAFLVLEPDLQLGEAVGHVINSLAPSPAHTEQVAAGGGARHASALDVLKDPGRNTGDFAQLVEAAGLGEALSAPGAVLTLFAPSNEALEAFLAGLQPAARQQLQANQSVADELVSGHMVAGVALGSKALQAQRWGSLKSQAGDALAVTQDEGKPAGPTARPAIMQEAARVAVPGSSAQLAVDGASILEADVGGGKAVVHVIDGVLVPAALREQLGLAPAPPAAARPRPHQATPDEEQRLQAAAPGVSSGGGARQAGAVRAAVAGAGLAWLLLVASV